MNDKYLPQELINPDRVRIYEKWVDDEDDMQLLYKKIAMLSETNDSCHKYCGFNKFTVETFPIPSDDDGWENIIESHQNDVDNEDNENNENNENDENNENENKNELDRINEMIKRSICDPSAKIFCPLNGNGIDLPTNCKMYQTLDNYETGFVVFISEDNKQVHVYGRTNDVICDGENDENDENINLFTNKIITYEPLEIFIGKSPLNIMTKFSGGYGAKWDGNSILLRIGNNDELKYVYLGTNISEFTTDEKITKYVSSVGNNCVPYPYAESANFCYDVSTMEKTPITDHQDREDSGNVSYVDSASYEKLNTKQIIGRGSYNARYEHSPVERTSLVRFDKPGKMRLLENTCTNDNLPLVQQMNNHLAQ